MTKKHGGHGALPGAESFKQRMGKLENVLKNYPGFDKNRFVRTRDKNAQWTHRFTLGTAQVLIDMIGCRVNVHGADCRYDDLLRVVRVAFSSPSPKTHAPMAIFFDANLVFPDDTPEFRAALLYEVRGFYPQAKLCTGRAGLPLIHFGTGHGSMTLPAGESPDRSDPWAMFLMRCWLRAQKRAE